VIESSLSLWRTEPTRLVGRAREYINTLALSTRHFPFTADRRRDGQTLLIVDVNGSRNRTMRSSRCRTTDLVACRPSTPHSNPCGPPLRAAIVPRTCSAAANQHNPSRRVTARRETGAERLRVRVRERGRDAGDGSKKERRQVESHAILPPKGTTKIEGGRNHLLSISSKERLTRPVEHFSFLSPFPLIPATFSRPKRVCNPTSRRGRKVQLEERLSSQLGGFQRSIMYVAGGLAL